MERRGESTFKKQVYRIMTIEPLTREACRFLSTLSPWLNNLIISAFGEVSGVCAGPSRMHQKPKQAQSLRSALSLGRDAPLYALGENRLSRCRTAFSQ